MMLKQLIRWVFSIGLLRLSFDCDCACASAPAAPNYQPLADSSKESAEVMAQLGREQLAETRRQYDQTKLVSDRVANSQIGTMDEAKAQGQDYFNYLKTFRPLETGMRDEAAAATAGQTEAERQAIVDAGMISQADIDAQTSADAADRATISAGYGANYDADRANISRMEGMAAANVAQQAGQAEQAGLRRMTAMGINPNSGAYAAMGRASALDKAKMGAGAINQARDAGVSDFRNRTMTSRDMRTQDFAKKTAISQQNMQTLSAGRNMRTQDSATAWAKKLDAAGLVRGMPGASQGAYSLATQAGNSAVQNTMAPGAQLLNGMAQGANITGAGRSLLQSGQAGVLGAQGSYNNMVAGINTANANMASSDSGGLGGILGGVGGIVSAGAQADWWSSKKLKEGKKKVNAELITKGLQRIPIEAWKYKEGVADEGEHIGPYAEDVNREFGEEAAPGGEQLDPVTMNGIALAVGKSNADRLDRIEKKIGLEREG